MALFRLHRGSLSDSLKTTVVVKNIDELVEHIAKAYNLDIRYLLIRIEPYPKSDDNFDYRIGWYTHIVNMRSTIDKKSLQVAGFLSENLEV